MGAYHPILYQDICYNLGMKGINIKKALIWTYILFLFFGFFYVRNVLKTKSIKEVKKEVKKVEEVHPAKVSLIVSGSKPLTGNLQSVDTLGDFLNYLRDENLLYFERTMYTYGTEINDINHVTTPEGYEWKMYLNQKDITFDIDNHKLLDGDIYELKLVKQ